MIDFNKSGFVAKASAPRKQAAAITPEQLAAAGSEHAHQSALFCWAALNVGTYPQLKWLFAIPNGGERNVIVATRLKSEGVKPGVPDIMLPVPCRHLHGLFIELKKPKVGRVRDTQNEWRDHLNSYGYLAVTCYGWQEAVATIQSYIAIGAR